MFDLHGQGFGSFVCWKVGICQLALSLWANCTVEPFIAAGLCAKEVDAVIVFLMTWMQSQSFVVFHDCSGQKQNNKIKYRSLRLFLQCPSSH